MKNIIKLKVALLSMTLALLCGCSLESPLQNVSYSKQVSVQIGTLAAVGNTVDGVLLSSVRIIAVNSDGVVRFNEYKTATEGYLEFEDNESTSVAGNFIANVFPGTYEFYVIINESTTQRNVLNTIVKKSDLEAINVSADEISGMPEEDMLFVGKAAGVRVREVPQGEQGMISADNGNTWSNKLNIKVARVATKLTVMVRKNTPQPLDSFIITGATLANTPKYSYMVPDKAYDGEMDSTTLPLTSTLSFSANSTDYTTIVDEYIMPEYILGNDPAITTLTMRALYQVYGGVQGMVEYEMPLLGDAGQNDDIVRNRHYIVRITISARGEFEYTPYITYEVGTWDKVADGGSLDIGGVIQTAHDWAPFTGGVRYEQGSNNNVVLIPNNGSATMLFWLMFPEGAQWKAYLTNDRDFILSGTTEGFAREGFRNEITIRPAGEFESDDIKTEFYILVNNLTSEVEVDVNHNEGSGPGNRYVIKYQR